MLEAERSERKLCLKMATLCGGGNIRGVSNIRRKNDGGTFMAEVEVGSRMDWEINHARPYEEGRDILEKDFEDGVKIRLCEGKFIFWGCTIHWLEA